MFWCCCDHEPTIPTIPIDSGRFAIYGSFGTVTNPITPPLFVDHAGILGGFTGENELGRYVLDGAQRFLLGFIMGNSPVDGPFLGISSIRIAMAFRTAVAASFEVRGVAYTPGQHLYPGPLFTDQAVVWDIPAGNGLTYVRHTSPELINVFNGSYAKFGGGLPVRFHFMPLSLNGVFVRDFNPAIHPESQRPVIYYNL